METPQEKQERRTATRNFLHRVEKEMDGQKTTPAVLISVTVAPSGGVQHALHVCGGTVQDAAMLMIAAIMDYVAGNVVTRPPASSERDHRNN